MIHIIYIGGRHGYGAKLTNIFSRKFTVETYDSKQQLLYKQIWEDNMRISHPPDITPSSLPTPLPTSTPKTTSKSSASSSKVKLQQQTEYTKISFEPDLTRFFMLGEGFDTATLIADAIKLFHRRTIDIAACVPSIKVTFNKKKVNVSSFADYVQLFSSTTASPELNTTTNTDDEDSDASDSSSGGKKGKSAITPTKVLYHKVNDRWEVGVTHTATNTFENMSFVNCVWTPDGGSHVNLVTSQVVTAIQDALAKKTTTALNTNTIKNKLMIFVKAVIENPSFESQSKLSLSSKPASFGSTCVLPPAFLKSIVDKSGVMQEILAEAQSREQSKLLKQFTNTKRSSSGLIDVPKLEDAHQAGSTKHSLNCTLILTEGDSAKALAVAGLEVVGRDTYGVLPLRGKILNVKQATTEQLRKNEELSNICKAIGLKFSETYESGLAGKGLRYGKVLLMCDQDHDGSHIKGLVINFFHHFWPHLLDNEGFLSQFITPLVKATSTRRLSLPAPDTPAAAPTNESGSKTKKSTKKQSSAVLNNSTAAAPATDSKGLHVISFYSMQEYNTWKLTHTSSPQLHLTDDTSLASTNTVSQSPSHTHTTTDKYKIKYYKGLGTNTSAEGREYFKALQKHLKLFSMTTGGNLISH